MHSKKQAGQNINARFQHLYVGSKHTRGVSPFREYYALEVRNIIGILLTAPWQIHHDDGENNTVVMW